jgi:hypothetical protein
LFYYPSLLSLSFVSCCHTPIFLLSQTQKGLKTKRKLTQNAWRKTKKAFGRKGLKSIASHIAGRKKEGHLKDASTKRGREKVQQC